MLSHKLLLESELRGWWLDRAGGCLGRMYLLPRIDAAENGEQILETHTAQNKMRVRMCRISSLMTSIVRAIYFASDFRYAQRAASCRALCPYLLHDTERSISLTVRRTAVLVLVLLPIVGYRIQLSARGAARHHALKRAAVRSPAMHGAIISDGYPSTVLIWRRHYQ